MCKSDSTRAPRIVLLCLIVRRRDRSEISDSLRFRRLLLPSMHDFCQSYYANISNRVPAQLDAGTSVLKTHC